MIYHNATYDFQNQEAEEEIEFWQKQIFVRAFLILYFFYHQ